MLHTFKVTLAKCLLMMTSFVLITIAHAGGSYDLGVYYYPGWKFNEVGNWIKEPWSKIKPYPYLEPLIGWYDESDPSVIAMQTKWMREYGINYIIFDWYWGPYLASRHEHALRNYLALKDKSSIDFAIMWANHDESPKSFDEFKSAVNYWIDNYFSHKEYKKIDGEPVVYFFSANLLEEKARKFGATTAVLLSEANRIATSRGLKGIKFVGGVGAYDKYFSKGVVNDGYFAYSAYNYHTGKKTPTSSPERNAHSYYELNLGYQYQWKWFFDHKLRYITPVTSGWNKRPWGGSDDPLHDNSNSSLSEFRDHLIAAKNNADQSDRFSDQKMLVICCWNEYGEGSVIEPTKMNQFNYLRVVKEVFANE